MHHACMHHACMHHACMDELCVMMMCELPWDLSSLTEAVSYHEAACELIGLLPAHVEVWERVWECTSV